MHRSKFGAFGANQKFGSFVARGEKKNSRNRNRFFFWKIEFLLLLFFDVKSYE
jgi:hypothetical protein